MVTAIALSPNKRHFFSSTTSGRLDLWDLRKLKAPVFGTKAAPTTTREWKSKALTQEIGLPSRCVF